MKSRALPGWLGFIALVNLLPAQVELVHTGTDGPLVVMGFHMGDLQVERDGKVQSIPNRGPVGVRPGGDFAPLTGEITTQYAIETAAWRTWPTKEDQVNIRFEVSFHADQPTEGLYGICEWVVNDEAVGSVMIGVLPVAEGEAQGVIGRMQIERSKQNGRLRAHLFHKGKSLNGLSKADQSILPLRVALDKGDQTAALEWLREKGAKTRLPKALIEEMARMGSRPLLEQALANATRARGADGIALLNAAAETGRTSCVALMLERKIKPDVEEGNRDSSLRRAIRAGSLDVVDLLLAAGANPNAKSEVTPILEAFDNNNPAMVKLLLQRGAKWPGAKDCDAIFRVSVINDWVAQAAFVASEAKGLDVDGTANRKPSLIAAASRPRSDMVQLLLKLGARIDVADEKGFTALMSAANSGARESVHLLLAQGASPIAQDKDGRVAAAWAVLGGKTDVAIELLDKHPLAMAPAARVLHDALKQRDLRLVEELVARGTRLDPSFSDIDDVVDVACRQDNWALVELALVSGMNPHRKIYGAWNLAGLIKRYNYPAMGEALTKRLGQPQEPISPKADKLPVSLMRQGAGIKPAEVGDDVLRGEAQIDVYVDAEGIPRLPIVRTASDPRMGKAACESVLRCRFNEIPGKKVVWRRVIVPVAYSSDKTPNAKAGL